MKIATRTVLHGQIVVEGRIVNNLPQYTAANSRAELVQELLGVAKTWKNIGSVRIAANDIHAFICARGAEKSLHQELPDEFRSIPILSYRDSPVASQLLRLHERSMRRYRSRERVISVVEPPSKDSVRLDKASDGAYFLPRVSRIRGARLFQDELNVQTEILVQYEAVGKRLCDLAMPIRDGLFLLNALRESPWRSGLDPLNLLDEHDRPRDFLYGEMTIGSGPLVPRRRTRG